MLKAKILVVDDNDGIRAALKILLMRHFAEVELIASPKELRSVVMRFKPDVVLLDMNFYTDMNTGNEGLFCLSELKRFAPQVEVVLFTAYADIQLAVEGMKRGAFDFVVKPWDNDRLVEILKSAYNRRKKEAQPQAKPVSQMYWGEGDAMQTVRRQIERFAPTDATILITGENGTGKDVLANEIHRLSDRAMRPMVCVDAGAITETLFESELFGHVKGAFTDAHADKIGKFEQANGGTLFLDEIGNIPLHLQAKLLRVLQNRAVTRVGDTKERPIDIRLICATNKDIPQMVQEGTFREDLYYRINTLHVQLPPLRQRTDEILPLAERFVNLYAEKYHRAVASVSAEAAKLLLAHSWSGNIRELQNCIEKAVILSDGVELLSSDIQLQTTNSQSGGKFANGGGLSYSPPVLGVVPEGGGGSKPLETLEAAEERTIRAAMNQYDGNLSLVAKSLDISRPTLYAKLKKYGI